MIQYSSVYPPPHHYTSGMIRNISIYPPPPAYATVLGMFCQYQKKINSGLKKIVMYMFSQYRNMYLISAEERLLFTLDQGMIE